MMKQEKLTGKEQQEKEARKGHDRREDTRKGNKRERTSRTGVCLK